MYCAALFHERSLRACEATVNTGFVAILGEITTRAYVDLQEVVRSTVRDIGLGVVDRVPPLKDMFIRQAAGLAGEVPRLLKGEAL